MSFPAVKLSDVAPIASLEGGLPEQEDCWLLNLDRVEANSGRVLSKLRVGLDEIGSSTHSFGPQHVLYSKLRPNLNKVVVPDEYGFCTSELVPLQPDKERLDRDYLAFYLRSPDFVNWAVSKTAGAKMPRLSMKLFGERTIPLPPLATQRHIAKVLEQADRLRRQAQQMEAELDRLAQALFLEMFGDPVGNPKGWPIVRLGQHLEAIESGWSPTCSEQQAAPGEWGVLKLGAVTSCTYRETENKKLPDELSPRLKLEVKAGDLLFSRKNTYALVAASAYVRKTQGKIMLSDLIFRLVPGEMLSPIYLWGLLVNPSFRSEVQSLAGGAAGSMPNISKAKLGDKEIPLPPIETQKQYAEAVQSFWGQLDLHKQRADQLDCLFNSLMQRAFQGELVPKLA